MRLRTAITLIYTLMASHCVAPYAWAQRYSLEAGLVVIGFLPTAPGESPGYAGIGGSGTISFEAHQLSFGVRTQGSFDYSTPFKIEAGSYNLNGDLGRRQISLALISRYFFSEMPVSRKWYLEFLIAARAIDFIHADNVYTIPDSPQYTRLFLRGGGVGFGLGYRPLKGPYFFQFNYELDHYENLIVEGEVNHLHQTVANPALNYNYFVHCLFLTVGIDVFGR